MSLEELQLLVKKGEGLHLEFKHKAADPLKIMREVVAFSNCLGGKLLIGVDDDGTICGVKDAEEEIFALTQAIEQFCQPQPIVKLYQIVLNRKRTVLVLDVKQAPSKPMFVIYNPKRKIGRAYFRVEDKSVQASRELRKILKMQQKGENPPFVYGEAVQALMGFLRQNPSITLPEFMELAQLPEQEASDILIRLTAANVLSISPSDKLDSYSLPLE